MGRSTAEPSQSPKSIANRSFTRLLSAFMHFPPHERAALELVAETAILQEHNIAVFQDANRTVTVGEPMFVARLCKALTIMANGWRGQLMTIDPGARLSITSIFTHQKPYVHFPSGVANPDRCELADLAVVLIDRSNPAQVASRCLFVQAKRVDAPQVTLLDPGDLRQLAFYTGRPKFDVARRNAPAGINFPAPLPDNALNYGLTPPAKAKSGPVGAGWANTRWTLAQNLQGHPTHQLTGNRSLQSALVDLLEGSAGWVFNLAAANQDWTAFSGRDNWSALINFILEDTATALAPSYARGVHRERGYGEQGMFLQYADKQSNTAMVSHPYDWAPHSFAAKVLNRMRRAYRDGIRGVPPYDPREPDDDEEGGGPMSVAVIEIALPRRH